MFVYVVEQGSSLCVFHSIEDARRFASEDGYTQVFMDDVVEIWRKPTASEAIYITKKEVRKWRAQED